MKKNGFTLVEMIAVVVILGVVSSVAVPSVIGTMEKNKVSTYRNDASRLLRSAKAAYEKDTTIEEPSQTSCVIFKIDDLNTTTLSGPNKGEYQSGYSYVTINMTGNKLVYGVQLLEKYSDNANKEVFRGIRYTYPVELNSNAASSLEVTKINNDKSKFLSIDDLRRSSSYSNCRDVINNGTQRESGMESVKSEVTYDYKANGGTSMDTVSDDDKLRSPNDEINLTLKAKKDGYEFVGWNTNRNSKDGMNKLFMSDDDITLYAIFKKTYTAKFNYYSNGETVSKDATCTVYNKTDECAFEVPEDVRKSSGPNGTNYNGISAKEDSKESVEEYTSKNLNYYAFYDGTFSVQYTTDDHSRKLSKREDSCYVTSNISDGKYSDAYCTFDLPTYSVDGGYKKYGFIDTTNNKFVGNEGDKYKLTRVNARISASTNDTEKPINIKLDKQSGSKSSSHTVKLSFEDLGSGLDNSIRYKWGLSTSKNVEPKEYYTDIVATNGNKSVSREIVLNRLTGSYYLWVVPISYKDKYANENNSIVISDGVFILDNPGNIELIRSGGDNSYRVNKELEINADLRINSLSSNPHVNKDLLNNTIVRVGDKIINGTSTYISKVTDQNTGAERELRDDELTDDVNITIKIPSSNSYYGPVSIEIPGGAFYDNYGNKTSGTSVIALDAEITKNKYDITYDLNSNGDAVTNDNIATYSPDDSDYALKVPVRKGYTFTGWSGSNGETPDVNVVLPRNSVGDKEYKANWEPIKYTINYERGGSKFSSDPNYDPNPGIYTVETDSFTLVNPSIKCMTFIGWNGWDVSNLRDEKDTGEVICTNCPTVTIEKGSIGDRRYEAKFEATKYKINYVLYGGVIKEENKDTYTCSADFVLPEPEKKLTDTLNAEFIGWTGEGQNSLKKDITIKNGSDGEKTYYAHYREGVLKVKSSSIKRIGRELYINTNLDAQFLDNYEFNYRIKNLEVYVGDKKVSNPIINYDSANMSISIDVPNSQDLIGDVTLNIPEDAVNDNNLNTSLSAVLSVGNTEDVKIDAPNTSINVGDKISLSVNQDDVVWKSSNPDFATVDENGVVTGIAKGTTIITATRNDKKDEVSIDVN